MKVEQIPVRLFRQRKPNNRRKRAGDANKTMVLNQLEIDECRKSFANFDIDESGTIDV